MADVIALSGQRTRYPLVALIQCKTFGMPSKDERTKLGRAARESAAVPVCAFRKDGRLLYVPLHGTGTPVSAKGWELARLLTWMCWGD